MLVLVGDCSILLHVPAIISVTEWKKSLPFLQRAGEGEAAVIILCFGGTLKVITLRYALNICLYIIIKFAISDC